MALLFVALSCSSSSATEPTEPTTEPTEETLTPPTLDNEEWCGVIKADEYYGRKLTKHFYDLKYAAGAINSTTKAYTYFKLDNMNGIRCSIFGNDDAPAHPSSGVVEASYYEKMITSIKYAMIARGSEPLTIFASKKLNGTGTFPSWVKESDGLTVNPENYSKMLLDFIEYMDSEGITIDVLGIDNEIEYSKSGLEPDTYHATVTRLKERLTDAGLPIPLFIAPERYKVNNTWMQTFFDNEEYHSSMDIYGMHYYPTQRDNFYDPLKVDLELKGEREFWATEPHWNIDSSISSPYTDVLHYAEDTIGAIWDQTDLGLDNIIWWAYSREGDTRGYLIYNITVPIFEAQPIMVEDHDGWDIRDSRLLHTRAFRRDNTIIFYALNLCANTAENENYTNYHFKVEGAKVAGTKASQRQWRDDAMVEGESSTINVYDGESIYLNLPSRSITMVELTLE